MLFILLLISLVLITLYGLIPGVNHLLGRSAAIVFLNPYPRESIVEFNGKTYRLEANAPLSVMGIYGRMPRKERLRFISKENQVDYSVKVPLHAGETVLVNPFKVQSFGVLKCESRGVTLPAELKTSLIQSLADGKQPSLALQLANECREIGKGLLLATTDDEFVRSTSDIVKNHHFAIDELTGSGSIMDENRMTISRCLSPGVSLGDVTVYYRKGKMDIADCSFLLDLGSKGITAPWRYAKNMPQEYHEFSPVTGTLECHVSEEEKHVLVRMLAKSGDFSVRRYQRLMKGQWSYEGRYDKQGQVWTWQWKFNARDEFDICTLRLTVDEKGHVESIYKEKREDVDAAKQGT